MPTINSDRPPPRSSSDGGVSSSSLLYQQWQNPGDTFTICLIIGSGLVRSALAQLVGSRITPVAFSFGWVSYAIEAVVSAVGGNKLMPPPDCACKVINGRNGYVRDNSSWIIGRIVRDYEKWMDDGLPQKPIREMVRKLIDERFENEQNRADRNGKIAQRPSQAGLCVAIFRAGKPQPGYPGYDFIYFLGFGTAICQLGIATVPYILFKNWAIILVTACGILLSFITGGLTQWSKEKWGCRLESNKNVILTKGNGSQHAIIVIGDGKGLDLEDLANQNNANISASANTKAAVIFLAILWTILLITATGITENTWYLIAVAAAGIFENILVAGLPRHPKAFGVHLEFDRVIGHVKVMDTLYAVEEAYPRVGKSMLPTFFPGELNSVERKKWQEYQRHAEELEFKRNNGRYQGRTTSSSSQ